MAKKLIDKDEFIIRVISILKNYKLLLDKIESYNIKKQELDRYLHQKRELISNLLMMYENIDDEKFYTSIKRLWPLSSLRNIYNDYDRIEPGLVGDNNWSENRIEIINGFESIMKKITELGEMTRNMKGEIE